MEFPDDLHYYRKGGSHVWFRPEGDTVRVGMDAFLTKNAGHITYFTVDEERAVQGEGLGSFESAKFVSRFYSPVSGEVVEVNEAVLNNPRLINDDPYGSWVVSIRPERLAEEMASPDVVRGVGAITAWINEELKRLDEED